MIVVVADLGKDLACRLDAVTISQDQISSSQKSSKLARKPP